MRYLISGYYGEGNLGDEAILAGILQEIRVRDPRAEFTVLSFSPEDTERRHGVRAVTTSLRDPRRLLGDMRAHDVLISGGGSFLHEADFDLYGRSFWRREGKLRPIPYFLAVAALAELLRLPVVFYSQGLGPLHTFWARRAVAAVASRASLVTWRDRDSALLSSRIGVRTVAERIVPDPAYALAASPSPVIDEALDASGVGSADFIALALRPWLGRAGYQEQAVAALSSIATEWDVAVLLVPFQQRLDGPLTRRLAEDPRWRGRAFALEGVDDPRLLSGILGRAQCAVTMRLHAGILAAAAGTPSVPVVYDPKVAAFARQTEQDSWAVDVDELETVAGGRALADACRHTLFDLDARRAVLDRAVAPLREEAGVTAALTVQVAENGGRP